MQSLIARGLDPLTVLVDRAHEKGMDFIASLRMGGYGGMAPEHALNTGGRGFVHPEVRDHQRAILKELANEVRRRRRGNGLRRLPRRMSFLAEDGRRVRIHAGDDGFRKRNRRNRPGPAGRSRPDRRPRLPHRRTEPEDRP